MIYFKLKSTLFSRLNAVQQKHEIVSSKTFLDSILKKSVSSFCYPYGGKNSYNKVTLKILKEAAYTNAVMVQSRDVNINDLNNKLFELPRYDCNEINKIFSLQKK